MGQSHEHTEESDPSTDAGLASLYAANRLPLLRFLIGVLKDRWAAEDVLQETFGKALKSMPPPDSEHARAWLFRTAFNAAIDWRRRHSAEAQRNRRLAATIARTDKAADPLVDAEMSSMIRKEIDDLPALQKQVLRLRIEEELTFAEIARRLDVPIGTVLTRMRTALENLRGRIRCD